jgi:hypothetical protein
MATHPQTVYCSLYYMHKVQVNTMSLREVWPFSQHSFRVNTSFRSVPITASRDLAFMIKMTTLEDIEQSLQWMDSTPTRFDILLRDSLA